MSKSTTDLSFSVPVSVADNNEIDGPGKTSGALTFSPHDLKPLVKALQCCSNNTMSTLAAAPILSIVQSDRVSGPITFLPLMFQEPPSGLTLSFPECKTVGAVSTRPGTAIILGLTLTPKAAYEIPQLEKSDNLKSQD